MLDFNLSNCPHRYNASPAVEEEADLLTSIWLVTASIETLLRSQPELAGECCLALEKLSQILAGSLN